MNTQQIRDEIARAQGFHFVENVLLPDKSRWARDDGGMEYFAPDHPLPDTIDAAVEVIEGAGWTIVHFVIASNRNVNTIYMQADRNDGSNDFIDACVDVPRTHDATRAAYRDLHWQLALACVKATVTNDNNPPAISQNGGE